MTDNYEKAVAILERSNGVIDDLDGETAVAAAVALRVAMAAAQVRATLAVADALHQLAPQ